MADKEALLTEVREKFEYYNKAWRPIRDEGQKDMKYISGDPWDPAERKLREDTHRPCVALDELNQYVNQLINDVRMNKRSIKVDPKGDGATDKTAEIRQELIRGIEYESNAQTAYTTAFEGGAQRGYGYARVKTQYASEKSFNQVIRIARIPNPDTVLMDPDCKEADCSDAMGCFVIDVVLKSDFAKKYPKAKKKSFDVQDMKVAPDWIKGDSIIIAEYWRVDIEERTMMLLDDKSPEGLIAYLDEYEGAKIEGDELVMEDGMKMPILKTRTAEKRVVTQFITNGLEILEENEWAGRYIPVIPCYGKEMYIDDGSGAKRVLVSLVRLARDPYKMYCFLRSQQAEEATMTPRVPAVGAEGQFEGHEDEWRDAAVVPRAFLQYKPMVEGSTEPLGPPTRPQFTPNFQSYELACDSMKRAIQSAMGMYNSSVGKNDTSAKSGVAVKALDTQSSQGNFHFIDNYDRFMQHMGRVIDDLIPAIYDTAREVGVRKADDTHKVVKINSQPEEPDQEPLDTTTGEHVVTISTGASFQSQREEAAGFVDSLMSNLATLPLAPDVKTKLLALSIKLKDLGPIGDQMIETIDPADAQQMQAQQMAQAKQQLMQMHAYVQQVEQQLQQLQLEKQAKAWDNEAKLKLEQLKIEAQITIAEIQTKAQQLATRMKMEADTWAEIHGAAHEAGLQADQQNNAQAMQAQAAQTQAAQQTAQPGQ